MAELEHKRSKEIPIWSAAWHVFELCDKVMMRSDKDHKHTIGRELVSSARLMLRLIEKANRERDIESRLDVLDELLDEYHDIANMIKYLAENSTTGSDGVIHPFLPAYIYLDGMKYLSSVERQANGWYNSTLAYIRQRADETAESNSVLRGLATPTVNTES